jgi:hypothetical protein
MFGVYFYHNQFRKYISYFGTLFNDIRIRREDGNGTAIQTLNVPITYGPKHKFIARIEGDPDLLKSTAIQLPMMSYEITSVNYNADRRLIKFNSASKKDPQTSLMYTQYTPAPYDLYFQLTIYTKNADDMFQIIEQILPEFSPAYTATLNIIDNVDYAIDVPVMLQSVVTEDSYEGAYEDRRYIQSTLTFTMQCQVFGATRRSGLIKKAIINLNTNIDADKTYLYVTTDIGKFQRYEYLLQEHSNGAISTGVIFAANSTVIGVTDTKGTFNTSDPIVGETSQAKGRITDINVKTHVAERITVQPAMTANGTPTTNTAISVDLSEIDITDNFGISVNIEEL